MIILLIDIVRPGDGHKHQNPNAIILGIDF